MSGTERSTESGRLRRLLNRALVFTGTAVAGTSAVWLLGAGIATAETTSFGEEDQPVDVAEMVETSSRGPVDPVEESGQDGSNSSGPATLDPTELDATRILTRVERVTDEIASTPERDSGAVTAPVSDSVHELVRQARPVLEPVDEVTRPVLEPAGEVTGEVLEPVRKVTESVGTGLEPVEQSLDPLVPDVSETLPIVAPDRNADCPEHAPNENAQVLPDHRDASPMPRTDPAPVPASQSIGTTESRPTPSPDTVGVRDGADVPPEPRPLPWWQPLVPMPAPLSSGCGGATGDSGGSNGGVGLCWLFGAALLSETRGSTTTRRTTPALTGGPKPQPGTNPD
ncbi:hypothetical protein FHX42_005091 [Saccharopolyspora lacisalsi]|uniref:Uncharacterized protein n=1 Tax=Halosaccharopolyspora lacisalsi TaxID=1000566 RepID=A0A839E4Z7_9PSEU|nr:hypothetical protein [Halosaccharopolyspora lacisalsi]MBA8827686.1 hypothetical protein [Halosaccharopolyspora lacisalsi]